MIFESNDPNMKKFTLIFLLSISCLSHGQVYFDTTNVYYYVSDEIKETENQTTLPTTSKMMPVWVVKQHVYKDSSLLSEFFKYINFEDRVDSNNNCVRQSLSGNLGLGIIESDDTITLFNQFYQPIKISLKVNVGDTFKLFEIDSLFVLAYREQDKSIDLFDTLYTTKEYRLLVYKDSNRIAVNNPFHNSTIQLAKGIGFVSIPSMAQFPYSKNIEQLKLKGILNAQKRQHLGLTIFPKPSKLYDVGDEFHTHFFEGGRGRVQNSIYTTTQWQRNTVIGKQIIGIDSCKYIYKREKKEQKTFMVQYNPNENYDSIFFVNDTITYYEYTPLPNKETITEKNKSVINESSTYIYHTPFPYNAKFNVVGDFYMNNTFYYADSVWCTGFSDNTPRYQKFHGIGIPAFNAVYVSGGTFSVNTKIVFAKKGNTTWGTPYPLNLSIQEVEQTIVIVYPNPAQNILFIESKQPIQSLELYSLEGKLLVSCIGCNRIDVSQIPNGFYSVKIQSQYNGTDFKRVVIQH